ncbi:hypothetical protein FSP39_008481 [Pinctada imbricata]|uniref:Dystroglycan 1 n=1 Tax=Pinctada imbricata TaxID=66713 RepID=A0AA89C711_PINIB|nr:hypothetical protein FSP39_008481 [Pinctada imbricata]
MWGIADTSATVGKMFNYAIPSDAFKGTVLKYKVSEAGKDTLPGWLMFDEKTNSLKGIATPDDMKHHYIEVIAQGDASDQITVLDVSAGSIVYSWTNNTLPTNRCPTKDVTDMMKKVSNDQGMLKKSAKRKLEPFVLHEVESNPLGVCEQDPNFPLVNTKYLPTPTPKPNDPDTTMKPKPTMEPPTPKPTIKVTEAPTTKEDSALNEKAAQGTSDDEIWITTVVPAVVVVAILLIALIIACVLYRKQRKGKMSLEDQHTFVNKGVPVILPDEYDEKPNDATKPLIMDDEKPPMPPPEYTRASSESSRSSHERHEEQEEVEMDETDVTSPLYRPPPPVQSTGSNKQPRPHIPPAYKNPTPYVPP